LAPADALVPGIEAQVLFPPGYGPDATYWPHWEYAADPFPQKYDLNYQMPPRRGLPTMDCSTSPGGWQDSHGKTCQDYSDNWWCTSDGKIGPGWPEHWGTLKDQAGIVGEDASKACCICGGGLKTMVTGQDALTRLDNRQLFAGTDAMPGTGMVPVKEYAVAPEDVIAEDYAKYFQETLRSHMRPGLMGLSARFYSSPPANPSVPVKASCIDRALEFGGSGAGSNGRLLQWPAIFGHAANKAGFFWGKWTGTFMLSSPGRYVFDLDVGFNTRSSLKIDGQALSTPGMCRVTPNRAACEAKGCVWVPDQAKCFPGKKGAASLLQVRVPGPAPQAGAPVGFSPAPAVAVAPAPMTAPPDNAVAYSPASDGFPIQEPAQEQESEEEVVALDAPQPAVAPAPIPGPSSAPMFPNMFSPAAMPDGIIEAAPFPAPAPAPAPPPIASGEVDETAGTVVLKGGGHCVEVTVMVTPSARSLALRYKGPDTSGKMTTVPGQVLFCDPVVAACEDPGPNTCVNFA